MPYENQSLPTRLWILRHGRSTLNDLQTFQGCAAASGLTEDGIRCARAAGVRLQSMRIDRIYASPLRRAIETAELVTSQLDSGSSAPVLEISDALREVELPGWEGKPYAMVQQQEPEAFRRFRESPDEFWLARGEGQQVWPVREMQHRVHHFLAALLKQQPGRNILLVTHGGPARMMLLAALALPVRDFHSVQVSHGGLSCIAGSAWPARMRLEMLNDLSHWDSLLPKIKGPKDGVRILLIASDQPASAETDESLARMLERLPIHRSFAAGQDGVTAALRLLRYRNRSAIETCSERALLCGFVQKLNTSGDGDVVNLLLTGRGQFLGRIMQRLMRWSAADNLLDSQLCRGLTVVHLPRTSVPPVLQTMNTYQESSFQKRENL